MIDTCCGWDLCCATPVLAAPCCGTTVVPGAVPTATPQTDQKPTLAPPTIPSPPANNPPALPKPAAGGDLPGIGPATPGPTAPARGAMLPAPARPDGGMLTVHVPANSKVYINGEATRSLGSRREYVSFGLESGQTYPYTISALVLVKGDAGVSDVSASSNGNLQVVSDAQPAVEKVREDGRQWVWLTKTVYLKAGQHSAVAFSDDLNVEKRVAAVEAARAYQFEQKSRENVPAQQERQKQERQDRIRKVGVASTMSW